MLSWHDCIDLGKKNHVPSGMVAGGPKYKNLYLDDHATPLITQSTRNKLPGPGCDGGAPKVIAARPGCCKARIIGLVIRTDAVMRSQPIIDPKVLYSLTSPPSAILQESIWLCDWERGCDGADREAAMHESESSPLTLA